jgi:hypothetical protein
MQNESRLHILNRIHSKFTIVCFDLNSDRIALKFLGNFAGGARPRKRVENPVARLGEELDEPFWQRARECGAMAFVSTFRREAQNIIRVGQITPDPIRNVFSKTRSHLGIEANDIVLPKIFQPRLRPITHRHPHLVLIHREIALLVELKAALPCVTKAIRPLSWMAVSLVPDEFLRPQPAEFSQSKNKFEHIGVSLSILDLLFNVQHKSTCGFHDPQKLFRSRQKPIHILIRLDAAIGAGALIGIRRAGHDQVYAVVRDFGQDSQTISLQNEGRTHSGHDNGLLE